MTFQKIKKADYNIRSNNSLSITVTHDGVIRLSRYLAEVLKISQDNLYVGLYKNEEYFYVCSTKDTSSFKCRPGDAKGKYPIYKFNAKALVYEMKDLYDLALGKNKKRSIRLDVDVDDPVEHEGELLYKIY